MKNVIRVFYFLLMLAFMLTLIIPAALCQIIKAVTVSQAGYNTDQLKTAIIVTDGPLSDMSYEIIKASDGSQVSSGEMLAYKNPRRWTREETYYLVDFSSFTSTGDFNIRSNGVTSYTFTIADNIWTNYVDEMVEFYRVQRCGVDTNEAVPPGFTNRPSEEALHGPCHTDDAKKESTRGPSVDMTGGWHDAGDNNKYQSNNGWVAGALAISYMRHPDANFDFDGNGIPDLLDEARFGAEYLLKVQSAADAGGGVYDTIDAPYGAYYAWKYPTEETDGDRGKRRSSPDDRVAHTRGVNGAKTALTYDATIKVAGSLAVIARAFASIDPDFSNSCKNGAIDAYNWALSNTDKKGGNYSISDQDNPRLWAAVELYLLTNDSTYGDWINSYINGLFLISTQGTNYWGLQPIALAEYYPVAGSLQDKIISLLSDAANSWVNGLAEPFGVSSTVRSATFGINEPNLSKAADALRLYEIDNSRTDLRDAAVKALQWTLGVNPWNISWVIGIGTDYVDHPHSRLDKDADRNSSSTLKLPGTLVCGANGHDTLDRKSESPWYMDRPLADDGSLQWRYNEFSISIQYGLVDMIVALAYGGISGFIPTSDVPEPIPEPILPLSGESLEAEAMLLDDYDIESNDAASGGVLIRCPGYTGTASYIYSGSSGTKDITVYYFDENDGACSFKLYVAGKVVDQWVAKKALGDSVATSDTLTTRTVKGVTVNTNDVIMIEGTTDREEWARVDKIEVTSAGTPQL